MGSENGLYSVVSRSSVSGPVQEPDLSFGSP